MKGKESRGVETQSKGQDSCSAEAGLGGDSRSVVGRHTPGPWRVTDGGDGITTGGNDEWFNPIGGCGCCNSPWINPGENEGEALANARLIAAAPDMYEAIRAMLDADSESADYAAIVKAQAAIAKAEGRATDHSSGVQK